MKIQLLLMFASVPGGRKTWAGEGITEKTWPGLRTTAVGPPNPIHCVGWTTVNGLMETGHSEPWEETGVCGEEGEGWASV